MLRAASESPTTPRAWPGRFRARKNKKPGFSCEGARRLWIFYRLVILSEAKDLCSRRHNAEVLRFAQDDTCILRGTILEFHMRPQARHHNRPPVAVVAGIVDVLYSGSDINSAPKVQRVIRFDDVLPPVVQPSIAQQETVPAIGQIDLVILLDPVRHKGNTGTILLAMPQRAIHTYALVEGRIDFGVGK